jgi:hypothetical protein
MNENLFEQKNSKIYLENSLIFVDPWRTLKYV